MRIYSCLVFSFPHFFSQHLPAEKNLPSIKIKTNIAYFISLIFKIKKPFSLELEIINDVFFLYKLMSCYIKYKFDLIIKQIRIIAIYLYEAINNGNKLTFSFITVVNSS